MLQTKKEDLEQFEEEAAPLTLDHRATSHERREWQRMVDENKVLVPRHRQDVYKLPKKLANVMREMQEMREQIQLHKRRCLGGH